MRGVQYDARGEVVKCLFCNIVSKKEPSITVFENDEMMIFRTIAPYVSNHLLCVPKRHIKSALELRSSEDRALLERMVDVSVDVVKNQKFSMLREKPYMCFHIPPWNSIDHLHLHIIPDPHTLSTFGSIKYRKGTFYCQSVEEVLARIKTETQTMAKL
jgi:diadenosine tetraphosphate (Ap4A) HIT family hydrolase